MRDSVVLTQNVIGASLNTRRCRDPMGVSPPQSVLGCRQPDAPSKSAPQPRRGSASHTKRAPTCYGLGSILRATLRLKTHTVWKYCTYINSRWRRRRQMPMSRNQIL